MDIKSTSDVVWIPTSIGDLVDRLTITKIKLARARTESSRAKVKMQLKALQDVLESEEGFDATFLRDSIQNLTNVNETLWDMEDQIRALEARQQFDANFITCARSIYKLNDRRFKLKADIDKAFGAKFSEIKMYKEEDGPNNE